ncbi:uncharacterized protein EI97DRAFT_78445 [Westerdykella ornata]|uniref:Uncharacterized protein n=1 Tax=Westerdykella ornata TaxID=318751 RepID=A0A6A6JEU8_WESOR|nr:uncharacterized protein EI97DRAFT_78445 [Westerdykella ornata]KAF2275140.1 hypothetical protein EI97DRAFT_78445 [Westerdykella ornata]
MATSILAPMSRMENVPAIGDPPFVSLPSKMQQRWKTPSTGAHILSMNISPQHALVVDSITDRRLIDLRRP